MSLALKKIKYIAHITLSKYYYPIVSIVSIFSKHESSNS